jgi:hypothetical protein
MNFTLKKLFFQRIEQLLNCKIDEQKTVLAKNTVHQTWCSPLLTWINEETSNQFMSKLSKY